MNGSTPDDPPRLHRDRAVPRAIRHLRAHSDDRQLRLSLAFLRLAAGFDLRTGSCRRTRQFHSGTGAVSEPPLRSLKDAAWLREGPLARLIEVLDRDGEEARVVGGAVRNAL